MAVVWWRFGGVKIRVRLQAGLWSLPRTAMGSIITQMSRCILFLGDLFLPLEYPEFLWCDVSMQCAPVYQTSPVCDASYQRIPKRWGRKRANFSESSFPWMLVLIYCCKETAPIMLSSLLFRRDLRLSPEFNLGKQGKLAAPQQSVCVSLLLQLKIWSCLTVSVCCIDSFGTHLCPIMEQSSCAVTSIGRTARPYLLIPGLKNTTNKSSTSGLPNVGHSHGPITGAGCYQKISVTEDAFFPAVLWYSQIWSCSRAVKGRHMEKWSVSVPR